MKAAWIILAVFLLYFANGRADETLDDSKIQENHLEEPESIDPATEGDKEDKLENRKENSETRNSNVDQSSSGNSAKDRQAKFKQLQSKNDKSADEEFLEKIVSYEDQIANWTKESLQNGINIRLVKKSWEACGPATKRQSALDVFSFDPSQEDQKKLTEELTKSLNPMTWSQTPGCSYHYEYKMEQFKSANKLLSDDEFNSTLPNIFIFPTAVSFRNIMFVEKTVLALGMRNLHKAYNVFAFDLSQLDFNIFVSWYNTLSGDGQNFDQMANAAVDFFVEDVIKDKKIPVDKINFIGWGYSAQLIGYLGRHIKQKTNQRVRSILALNPVGASNKYLKPINKDDAELVYIYHTNSFPLGSTARLGTADVVFNGGITQPECRGDEFLCSHDGAVHRFLYIILFGGNLFKARQCDSTVNFNFGECNSRDTVPLTYPFPDDPIQGKYFLRTTGTAPYGVKEEGTVNDPKVKETIEKAFQNLQTTNSLEEDLTTFMTLLVD